MVKLRLLITVLCFSCNLFAHQHTLVDSLSRLLKMAKDDTTKANLYNKIGDVYLNENSEKALSYFREAGKLSKRIHFLKGTFKHYMGISSSFALQGKFDSSYLSDLESLKWAKQEKDPLIYAQLLLNIGTTCLQMNDVEQAVKYIEEGKHIFYQMGNTEFDGRIYDLLQSLERIRHQYRKAVNYGIIAVEKYSRTNDTMKLCAAYTNLGLNYIELELFDSAKYCLDKAWLLGKSRNSLLVEITYNLNMAYIYMQQRDYNKVNPYAEKALELSRKSKLPEYEAIALFDVASYYLFKKEYQSAKNLADSALRISYAYNMTSVRLGVLPLLSHIAYGMQDTRAGDSLFTQYQLLNDSVLSESVTKNTIQTEKKYDTEKKESQIKLQQSQLKQKNILNYILIGSALSLLIISLLGYRNYTHRQKLQQAKIDELETEKQLTATEAILKGEEQERSRLAKDLHDGLGGMLSGIKYALSNMKENLIMTPQNANAFEHSINMLDNSIGEMRRVAHNLMPESLLKFGLDEALRDFCSEIDRNGRLNVVYQSLGVKDKVIEQSLSVAIYRITQELLNNILKHANAKQAIVQIGATENQLTITVEDDGKGVDTNTMKNSTGIGWNNIQSRVHYHKGSINIQSGPEKGTSVFIEFPIA